MKVWRKETKPLGSHQPSSLLEQAKNRPAVSVFLCCLVWKSKMATVSEEKNPFSFVFTTCYLLPVAKTTYTTTNRVRIKRSEKICHKGQKLETTQTTLLNALSLEPPIFVISIDLGIERLNEVKHSHELGFHGHDERESFSNTVRCTHF